MIWGMMLILYLWIITMRLLLALPTFARCCYTDNLRELLLAAVKHTPLLVCGASLCGSCATKASTAELVYLHTA